MKVVFMGTSAFAVPSLDSLLRSTYKVTGVITQPDRPQGRGKKLGSSPVKELATERGLALNQPERIKAAAAIEQVKLWEPDLIVVVSYGQIIPPELINFPRYGCINVHASLLPRYRGAAPIQRALMNGDEITGVTTMFMDEGLDTGDIILQSAVPIEDSYDHGGLESILAQDGARLLIDTIHKIAGGTAERLKQDSSKSTYAQRILAEDEKINWADSAVRIHNQIRALSPAPGAWFSFDGCKIKIFRSRVTDSPVSGVVSQLLEYSREGFLVQCGKGIIEILEVQRAGKKRVSARDFLRGCDLAPGTVFAYPEG